MIASITASRSGRAGFEPLHARGRRDLGSDRRSSAAATPRRAGRPGSPRALSSGPILPPSPFTGWQRLQWMRNSRESSLHGAGALRGRRHARKAVARCGSARRRRAGTASRSRPPRAPARRRGSPRSDRTARARRAGAAPTRACRIANSGAPPRSNASHARVREHARDRHRGLIAVAAREQQLLLARASPRRRSRRARRRSAARERDLALLVRLEHAHALRARELASAPRVARRDDLRRGAGTRARRVVAARGRRRAAASAKASTATLNLRPACQARTRCA